MVIDPRGSLPDRVCPFVGLRAWPEPFLTLFVEPFSTCSMTRSRACCFVAQAALDAILMVLNPFVAKLVLSALLTSNGKWQANEARLNHHPVILNDTTILRNKSALPTSRPHLSSSRRLMARHCLRSRLYACLRLC